MDFNESWLKQAGFSKLDPQGRGTTYCRGGRYSNQGSALLSKLPLNLRLDWKAIVYGPNWRVPWPMDVLVPSNYPFNPGLGSDSLWIFQEERDSLREAMEQLWTEKAQVDEDET